MCLPSRDPVKVGPTTPPAEKAPTAPVLPQAEDLRPGSGRKKLRVDLTQPAGGLAGLKIPV